MIPWQEKYRGTKIYHMVYAELIQVAQHRGTITYQDIAVIAGLPTQGSYMGSELGKILGTISQDEHDAGRPMLSAVVVHKDGTMGDGFFTFARELGLIGPEDDEEAFLKAEREKVYQTWARPIWVTKSGKD